MVVLLGGDLQADQPLEGEWLLRKRGKKRKKKKSPLLDVSKREKDDTGSRRQR